MSTPDFHPPAQPRRLPCSVGPDGPELGYDLMFRAGFRVLIPAAALGGGLFKLTTVFRVYPAGRRESAVYLSKSWTVPELRPSAGGEVLLDGAFQVGRGRYRVDWVMFDSRDRVCTTEWEVRAEPRRRDRAVSPFLPENIVEPAGRDPFAAPAAQRTVAGLLKTSILLHAVPQRPASATMLPEETSAMAAILRAVAADRRLGPLSLTAFSVADQEILYRSEGAKGVDWPALGRAIAGAPRGKVDARKLADKYAPAEFLCGLVRHELQTSPDALILVGPRGAFEGGISPALTKQIEPVGVPVVYLSYDLAPPSVLSDIFDPILKLLHGTEYTVRFPRDLQALWSASVLDAGRQSTAERKRR